MKKKGGSILLSKSDVPTAPSNNEVSTSSSLDFLRNRATSAPESTQPNESIARNTPYTLQNQAPVSKEQQVKDLAKAKKSEVENIN